MPHALPLPPAAEADPRSLEMIRVWLADEHLHAVLNVGFWEQRGLNERHVWGLLLADVVRHIADAHEAEFGRDPGETVALVREAFDAEIAKPTSPRLGEFFVDRRDG